MRFRVLGASGSEVPGHNCPAFLVDDTVLLDAGTIALSLNIKEERGIREILVTHAHFDHIKGIPFLLDNLVVRETGTHVTIISGKDVLEDLEKNVFNNRIWPDFTKIPSVENPVLVYRRIKPSTPLFIDGNTIIMEEVSHTVPAYGYILVNNENKAIAYTGDTGPTWLFWEKMAAYDIRCLILETSFPNRLTDLALKSGHLSPMLLEKEIAKMPYVPEKIYIMHIKPQHLPEIEREIRALGRKEIDFLKEGDVITL